jgi:hypothetical protein
MKTPSVQSFARVLGYFVLVVLVGLAVFACVPLCYSASARTAPLPISVSTENEAVSVTLFHRPCELGGVVDAVLRVAPEIVPRLDAGFAVVKATGERRRLCYVLHERVVFLVDELGGQGSIPVEEFK